MPNIRKKGKKLVSAWVPEKLHEQLRTLAKRQNCTASDVIDKLLTDYANTYAPAALNDAISSSKNTPPVVAVEVKSYSAQKPKSRNQTKTVRK